MCADRLQELLTEALAEVAVSDRMRHDPAEQAGFARIEAEAARACVGRSVLEEKTRRLELFARDFPVNIRPEERLFGSQRFTGPSPAAWDAELTAEERRTLTISGNHGHIIPAFPRLLRDGVDRTLERIGVMAPGEEKECFERSLRAFSRFVARHGETQESAWVAPLAHRGARDWREALQLLWLAVIFLHAEGNCAALSLGRFDEYMLEYYIGDAAENEEYLGEFLLKFTQGEESQNLTLSGRGDNPLFYAVLRLAASLRSWQPSISVIVSDDWSERQYRAAAELTAAGTGMPSYFGDATVRRGLASLGDPPEAVDRWGVVGCYEAAPSGDCYALTTAYQGAINQWFSEFFQSASAEQADFDAFLAAWEAELARVADENVLPELARRRAWMAEHQSSPFLSVWVDGCIESGRAVENGGARINHFGLNLMGLGSLVDSLSAVKQLVFEEKALTLAEFRRAVKADFPDERLRERCRTLKDKYGSDTPESNDLAYRESRQLVRMFNGRPVAGSPAMVTSLGLFWFGGDLNVRTPATPDGRRNGEAVSYGVGPGYFLTEYPPTALLNAAAALANDGCPNGNPLQLTLDAATLKREAGKTALVELLKSFFARGGFHLQFNLADAGKLADAQAHPERHRDLVVRVSGYSTLFNGVEKHWQDVLVERAHRGL